MKTFVAVIPLPKTPMLEQPGVGNLIRELRQLTALTQEELAAVLGVAYGTVNRWENGKMQPSTLALKQIYAVLKDIHQSALPEVRGRIEQILNQYFVAQPKI